MRYNSCAKMQKTREFSLLLLYFPLSEDAEASCFLTSCGNFLSIMYNMGTPDAIPTHEVRKAILACPISSGARAPWVDRFTCQISPYIKVATKLATKTTRRAIIKTSIFGFMFFPYIVVEIAYYIFPACVHHFSRVNSFRADGNAVKATLQRVTVWLCLMKALLMRPSVN